MEKAKVEVKTIEFENGIKLSTSGYSSFVTADGQAVVTIHDLREDELKRHSEIRPYDLLWFFLSGFFTSQLLTVALPAFLEWLGRTL